MKPTAVIVNVARAEILDEAALYQALADGAIGGARYVFRNDVAIIRNALSRSPMIQQKH